MVFERLQYEYGQRDISMQYAQLGYGTNCPEGIYVQLDDDDTHLWHCVIFIHGGPFSGGIFRFDIVFPPSYPLATPQVFFPPTLIHPLVEPISGQMSLALRFPNAWRPRQDFVTHLLAFVKDAFKSETLDSLREGLAVNLDVFKMYRDQRAVFNTLARQSAVLSTAPSSLYDQSGGSGFPNPSVGLDERGTGAGQRGDGQNKPEEANGILFSELDQDQMAALRREIFGHSS